MTQHIPLRIEVWTKSYVRKGVVGRPTSVAGSIIHNAPGTMDFTVDADHPRIVDLTADGARAVLTYRYVPGDTPTTLMSGTIGEVTGTGPASSSTRTFRIRDDWNILNDILGLPNPTGTMAQQGADTAYYTATGPAETVLKTIVAANAGRQGVTVTIPTTLGRGSSCTVTLRMHPLADRLFPTIDQAGIGVRVDQQGTSRVLDVYVPTVRSRVLTEQSGAIVNGDFQLSPPTVTRVLAGAGGEGTARVFREYVSNGTGGTILNPAAGLAGIETSLGWSRATFVDARDVDVTDPNLATILQARALEALTEGGAKQSLRVTLAETDQFRFGKTYLLGDRVSVQLAGSPVMTDLIREVQFDYGADSGLSITPIVGDWSSSSDLIYRQVAQIARAVRDSQRR
jgi:hypothetical protein